ncbi:39S ribosomal protein L52, mitochondrial isoform X1 [Alosa alosa]|uniref:39S ribosomal protein L52, mitochondrial isoform X1 n=1 Tax=Alosa alosa TaxID=278164 RepID=UPI0020154770|nr:39S ribosomal protein L52, mitochondrial isoform X1 [Alosa alosa]
MKRIKHGFVTHPKVSLLRLTLKHQCRSFSSTNGAQAGQIWRLSHGLPTHGSEYGPLTDLPDWSYVDGRPRPPMKGQARRQKEREEFARRVVSLSSEVDMGMKQWEQKNEAEKRTEEHRKSLLLKAKGNHKLKTK